MPFLPEVILSLLANFTYVFTLPPWRYAQTLLIGAILCNGKRTVSSALRAMGLSREKNALNVITGFCLKPGGMNLD